MDAITVLIIVSLCSWLIALSVSLIVDCVDDFILRKKLMEEEDKAKIHVS